MYGFHKIPHLQQGVLKSDSEAEFWNFEHPNFHRGQPDLLCLIQRKKQAAQGDEQQVEMNTSSRLGSPSVSGNLSAGQILDINSIVSGIAAIKRHQTAISTDLNDLKTSNQHLWQEAMAARERHKKHQDTINRILKFLAGVFGHQSTPVHKDDVHSPPRGVVVPRIPQRLLIEDGSDTKGKGINIAEIPDDEPDYQTPYDRGQSPSEFYVCIFALWPPDTTSDRFASVETPLLTPLPAAPPSGISPSETYSPSVTEPTTRFSSVPPTPLRTDLPQPEPPGQSSYPNNDNNTTHPPMTLLPDQHTYDGYQSQQQQPSGSSQLTTTSPRSQSPDPMLQAAFAQMLQSPGQMQRLLSALASQSMNPMPEPPPPPGTQQSSQQLQQYDPPIDYSGMYNPDQLNPQYNPSLSVPLPIVSSPLHRSGELASYDSLAEDNNRLQKTYRDAAEIEEDVDALHTSINSLIESLGLDPNVMEVPSHSQDTQMQEQSAVNPHDTVMSSNGLGGDTQGDLSGQDFDFDQFLTDLSRHGDENADYTQFAEKLDSTVRNDGSTPINDPSPEQLTAFLDEVQSTSDGTVSPVAGFTRASPELNSKRGSKRKSEVAGIPAEEHSTGKRINKQSSPGTKSKRKR